MATTSQASAAPKYAPPAVDGHRAAVIASFLGWTLDAFDFFLVTFALTAIGKEFGQSDKAMALSITLTLAFRPVGAFIFGLMADRYGRRIPLMIDLIFYSIVEVATGFAHNFTTFMILRALFGIGMGASGEWERRSRWRRPLRIGAAFFRGFCRKATRVATCSPPCASSSCFRVGDGGQCSSSAGCPRCSRCTCART